jgi:hypothetical protein
MTEKPADGPDEQPPPPEPPPQPLPKIERKLWPRIAWFLFVTALYLFIGGVTVYFAIILVQKYAVRLFRGP